MPTERDSQRSKLYKAEKVLDSLSARLETIPEVEAYMDKVLSSAPIQRRYAKHLRRQITVKDGRGVRTAKGCRYWVKLPRWARTQYIVLHEVAHSLTQRIHGDDVAGHGWQYAAIYLDLVRFGMGTEAHATLKASFKAGKVRFTEKRKREATPEQLQRLAVMRAARLR